MNVVQISTGILHEEYNLQVTVNMIYFKLMAGTWLSNNWFSLSNSMILCIMPCIFKNVQQGFILQSDRSFWFFVWNICIYNFCIHSVVTNFNLSCCFSHWANVKFRNSVYIHKIVATSLEWHIVSWNFYIWNEIPCTSIVQILF